MNANAESTTDTPSAEGLLAEVFARLGGPLPAAKFVAAEIATHYESSGSFDDDEFDAIPDERAAELDRRWRGIERQLGEAAAATIPAQPGIVPPAGAALPPFPTPEMGLSVEETFRRLIAWDGGPISAAGSILASIGDGVSFENATNEQTEAVLRMARRLEDHISATWPDGPDQFEAVAAA